MRLMLVCVLGLVTVAIHAQEPIGQGLTGTMLRQHLRTAYTPSESLSYKSAREHMFETIDDLDGETVGNGKLVRRRRNPPKAAASPTSPG